MPGENNVEGGPVEIFIGVVDMVLPVGELWTFGVVNCCVNLLVEYTEGIEENIVDVVTEVVGLLELFEEIRFVGVLVGGVGMLVEKVGEGVAVEIVVDGSVNMPVTVEELRPVDVVLGGIFMLVGDIFVVDVVKEFVVMLPQFSSQHSALIS